MKTISAEELIALIKSHVVVDEKDIHITLETLVSLKPTVPADEIIGVLTELDGVTITDSKLGGILIPIKYFQ